MREPTLHEIINPVARGGSLQKAIDRVSAQGGGRVTVPHGVYETDWFIPRANVWLDLGTATLKKRTDDGLALIHAVETKVNGSFYGTYKNIRITGGFLDANGKSCQLGLIRMLFQEHLTLENVTIVGHPANRWATMLGGRHGRVTGCTFRGNPTTIFQDGIHVMHGSHWRIDNNDVHSGDDCIALGSATDDSWLQQEPESLEFVSVSNNVVRSEKGYALKVYALEDEPSAGVSDVVVNGLTGHTGISRNGGMWFKDYTASGKVQRVQVSNVSLKVGGPAHDGVNASCIRADDVGLSLTDVHVRHPQGWQTFQGSAGVRRKNVTFEVAA